MTAGKPPKKIFGTVFNNFRGKDKPPKVAKLDPSPPVQTVVTVAPTPPITAEETWHLFVQAIDNTGSRGFQDGSSWNTEPLLLLQAATEKYLQTTGNTSVKEQSSRLKTMVKKHPAKRSAFASCAQILTPDDAKELILACFPIVGPIENTKIYLSMLIFLGQVNRLAVSEAEEACAKKIVDILCTTQSYSSRLTELEEVLIVDMRRSSLLDHLPTTVLNHICNEFFGQLDQYRMYNQWHYARLHSAWLADLTPDSTIWKCLDSMSPLFDAWKSWQPNNDRIALWHTVSSNHTTVLRDLFALEGPDFSYRQHSTLREGIATNIGTSKDAQKSFVVDAKSCSAGDAETMFDQILTALDNVISTAPSMIESFQQLCLRIFQKPGHLGRLNAIVELLPMMEEDSTCMHALRDAVAPILAAMLEPGLARLQKNLNKDISAGKSLKDTAQTISSHAKQLQQASWLVEHLSERTRTFLVQFPSHERAEALLAIRTKIKEKSSDCSSALAVMVDAYTMSILVGEEPPGSETMTVIEALVSIWNNLRSLASFELALTLATREGLPVNIRVACLHGIVAAPEKLRSDLCESMGVTSDATCARFAAILIHRKVEFNLIGECWHRLFHFMITERGPSLASELHALSDWFEWVGNLRKVVMLWEGTLPSDEFLLKPELLEWTELLATRYMGALRSLEKRLGVGPGMKWIVRGFDQQGLLGPVLEFLDPARAQPLTPIITAILDKASPDGANILIIMQSLRNLCDIDKEGGRLCFRILALYHISLYQMAELLVTAWCRQSDIVFAARKALTTLAQVLGIRPRLEPRMISTRLAAGNAYLDKEYSSLITYTKELERTRRALQLRSLKKTTQLVQTLGIKVHAGSAVGADSIPVSLLNYIEQVGEHEYELFFPLTKLEALQRQAMAVGDARGLIVRVSLKSEKALPMFCMHLHPGSQHSAHRYWEIRGYAPNDLPCHALSGRGPRSRTIYQLSRVLHGYLTKSTSRNVSLIYGFLQRCLASLTSFCIVCGGPVSTPLWRSIMCSRGCSLTWRRASLEVRLAELRHDPLVVDLLLSAAFAAATSNSMALLERCPLSNAASLLQAASKFTSVDQLCNAPNPAAAVAQLGGDCERLLAWAMHNYRGFLMSAKGRPFEIPHMNNVTQFVLINPTPEKQSRFQQHSGSTSVVFHGISLDRLYAILREGLIICSNTPLMKYGAVSGPGIYLAQEPSMSLNYAPQWTNSWAKSTLNNVRVVLGCELAGPSTPDNQGIHVINDESRVMIRYVFLLQPNAEQLTRANLEQDMNAAYRLLNPTMQSSTTATVLRGSSSGSAAPESSWATTGPEAGPESGEQSSELVNGES